MTITLTGCAWHNKRRTTSLSIGVRASIMRARMYASETSTYCTGVVAHSAMVARLCHGKGDRTQVSVVTGEETTRVLANDRLVASINISIHLHRYVPSPHLALQARLSVYLFIIHAPHQFGSVHIPGGHLPMETLKLWVRGGGSSCLFGRGHCWTFKWQRPEPINLPTPWMLLCLFFRPN